MKLTGVASARVGEGSRAPIIIPITTSASAKPDDSRRPKQRVFGSLTSVDAVSSSPSMTTSSASTESVSRSGKCCSGCVRESADLDAPASLTVAVAECSTANALSLKSLVSSMMSCKRKLSSFPSSPDSLSSEDRQGTLFQSAVTMSVRFGVAIAVAAVSASALSASINFSLWSTIPSSKASLSETSASASSLLEEEVYSSNMLVRVCDCVKLTAAVDRLESFGKAFPSLVIV